VEFYILGVDIKILINKNAALTLLVVIRKVKVNCRRTVSSVRVWILL